MQNMLFRYSDHDDTSYIASCTVIGYWRNSQRMNLLEIVYKELLHYDTDLGIQRVLWIQHDTHCSVP